MQRFTEPVLGDDVVTYHMFQGIRALAWSNGIALKNRFTRPALRLQMLTAWTAAEAPLDGFAGLGLL